MADILALQKALKSLLTQAEAIQTAAGEKPMTAEQLTSFKSLLAQAEPIKEQIDAIDKAEAIKGWMNESDGNSAVRTSFTRPDIDATGDIAGVSQEPVDVTYDSRGRKSATGGTLYGLNSLGDTRVKMLKSGAYKDAFVDYLRNTKTARGMKASSMKVLQEGVDESGGFWVPPDIRQDLVRKIAVNATVRPNAYVFTTGSDLATFPKVTYTTDDRYSSSVRAGWAMEAPSSNMSETANPVAGRVQIPVEIATAAIYLTRQQLEDNQFDILGYISQELAMAYGLLEEDGFTNGDGVAKPQGIQSHPNAQVAVASGGMSVLSGTSGGVAWGLSNTAGTATTGVVGVEAALPPQYEQNAKWFGNKNTYAALRALTDTAQRPLWQAGDAWPNMNNGYQPSLLGYGILKNMFMPTIASTVWPLGLGDLQGYFIADRVGLSIEVLREVAALRDMVVIYARKRVGGQLVKDWMVKLMKSNNS
jgi:HK97 family phage major capsid protein